MRQLKLVVALVWFFVALPLHATDYYVAVNGNDANPGTAPERPLATIARGQTLASAGDTVFIRGGTYFFSSGSGTAISLGENNINYFAFPGETPIFDFFALQPQSRVTGIEVSGNGIHLRGLELRGVQQVVTGDSWSIHVLGSNNILENLNVHDGEAPGIFIAGGSNNRVLNCDSHHNYDPLEGGGNADGFGCHTPGAGNLFSGCRSYSNSDDGFDFINSPGTCTVEKSWAFRNGYQPNTTIPAGNGSGFKAGGFGTNPATFPATIPRHVARMNVAFRNRSQGFYANHHPGGIDFFNNTAFNNSPNFDMFADVGASSHTLRNNIAFGTGGTITRLTGGTATFNSWNLAVTVTTADFLSVVEDEALLPRGADGSLPNVNFVHLAQGSDLIDAGTNVGLPFSGTAPDLGAFEFGAPTGSGGMAGAAGMAGAGGLPAGGSAGRGAGGATAMAGASSGGATTVAGASSGGATTVAGASSGGATAMAGANSGGATTVAGASSGGATAMAGASSGGATTVAGASSGGATAMAGASSGGATTTAGASAGGAAGTTNAGGAAGSLAIGGASANGGAINNGGTSGGVATTGGFPGAGATSGTGNSAGGAPGIPGSGSAGVLAGAGTDSGPTTLGEDGGCGCRVPSRAPASSISVAGALVAIAALRRRRRSKTTATRGSGSCSA